MDLIESAGQPASEALRLQEPGFLMAVNGDGCVALAIGIMEVGCLADASYQKISLRLLLRLVIQAVASRLLWFRLFGLWLIIRWCPQRSSRDALL